MGFRAGTGRGGDPADLPEGALERFLPREQAELLELFEPNRLLSRQLDVYGQALLAGWLEFAAKLDAYRPLPDEVDEYCADVAGDGYELAPTDQIDPERSLLPILIGTTVNGTLDDLDRGGEARLQELADLLGSTINTIERQQDGNPYGEGAVVQQLMLDIADYGYDMNELVALIAAVPAWQRMLWFAECALRQGAVLTPGRGEPLLGNDDEQLAYLLRLGAQQPGLARWPELHRFVPRRAEGLLPMTESAYARFRKHGIPADPELSARLTEEIVERRHYLLSSVSVIELEELGIRRIVLTPEEQSLASISGNRGAFCPASRNLAGR